MPLPYANPFLSLFIFISHTNLSNVFSFYLFNQTQTSMHIFPASECHFIWAWKFLWATIMRKNASVTACNGLVNHKIIKLCESENFVTEYDNMVDVVHRRWWRNVRNVQIGLREIACQQVDNNARQTEQHIHTSIRVGKLSNESLNRNGISHLMLPLLLLLLLLLFASTLRPFARMREKGECCTGSKQFISIPSPRLPRYAHAKYATFCTTQFDWITFCATNQNRVYG